MKKFIAKRLAQMLVVFVAVSIFAFSIIYNYNKLYKRS